jgi:hypothetical protein
MEIVEPARVVTHPERSYLGIRVVTPFRGMLRTRDELVAELRTWMKQSQAEPVGHGFLRLHVIDMSGPMDIEVGFLTRVRPGALPAGRYATLTHKDHSLRANRALIEWAHTNDVEFDRWDEPEGDRFACRYEAFLTDPKVEPRKKRWEVEIAIKVAD